MTPEDRDKLQDSYVHAVIDDMDMDSLIQYAADALHHYLDKESNDEFIDTVKEIYPELLNETLVVGKLQCTVINPSKPMSFLTTKTKLKTIRMDILDYEWKPLLKLFNRACSNDEIMSHFSEDEAETLSIFMDCLQNFSIEDFQVMPTKTTNDAPTD